MISQQLIEKYQALEEKRYYEARTNRYDHKSFTAAKRAVTQWNRVFVMYCNPNWKATS